MMEVDNHEDETNAELLSLVSQLLDENCSDSVIQKYRKQLPEIIHHAGEFVVNIDDSFHRKFIIVSAKLLSFNKFLKQHVEPWLCKIGCPWTSPSEPLSKRSRLDPNVQNSLLEASYQLLLSCERLKTSWTWVDIFPLLASTNKETRFLVIEIIRIIFSLSEGSVNVLRSKFIPNEDVFDYVLKYHVVKTRDSLALGFDSPQEDLSYVPTKVSSIGHVSLPKTSSHVVNTAMVEVDSTKTNLQAVGAAVCVGQPVLIVGDVGVGKTSLVVDWAARTGQDLVTLQVSDSTDARLLVGLYRCTEVPGQFVWEPGLLTRTVVAGHWLLIEDIDRASQDVISLLSPLVQEGQLNVPSLGGMVRAAPGFQLFLTQRDQCPGGVREELAKLVRTVTVASLSQEELKTVISTRFPNLTELTEKILRLFAIILNPADHLDYGDMSKLKYILGHCRSVSVRDLIKWCSRANSVLAQSSDNKAAAEILYQDAVDVFARFIPDIHIRNVVAQEIAFTFNISKDRAVYFTDVHKPNVSLKQSGLQVGRVLVPVCSNLDSLCPLQSVFSVTRHSATLLESVARAVTSNEPILLVGETGVGKTTSVQFLAEKTGRKLKVVNMNQQSDSADLLGGFKPVSLQRSLHKLREIFTQLFCDTFSTSNNAKFLGHLDTCFNDHRWSDALQLMSHTLKAAINKVRSDSKLFPRWKEVKGKIKVAAELIKRTDLATVFAFIEGILTEAIKAGDWILLDEVNMAPSSVLECLSQLLDNDGSVTLYEAGEHKSVTRHPDFRLFACMNPATDTGKADLAPGLRNRFTELFCDEMASKEDITMLITDYLTNLALPASRISSIVTFYAQAKLAAENSLTNGQGQRPTFSLRTLCRALKIASKNPCGSVKRSLFEAFSLAFLTELDRSSYPVVRDLIIKHVTGVKDTDKLLKQPILQSDKNSVNVAGFWIHIGQCEPQPQSHYILTDTVQQNLSDLARIVSMCEHPVLVQGDTSVGKTSLVTYLANITGNKVVRVNNHEHTDIQEYIGSYTSDSTGKLVFKHGVLAEAMLNGSWVILDELNLAPTDVLEALNRVLDDNRELFIPETGETIRASQGFRLFGTQNPPGTYGGRKVLSRAFKNRFIELHFDQLPAKELEIILTGRCSLPASYSKKMVAALKDLQKFRKGSAAFAGREGFITLRDLFRWAERYRNAEDKQGFYDWDQHLAEEGFMILAARVRNDEEVEVIKEILGKIFKRTIEPDHLFSLSDQTSSITRPILQNILKTDMFPQVAWTKDMRRLAVLLAHAWDHKEPVLLVGETGCGKTTVVDIVSKIMKSPLYSLSCHNNTESADFLGGLRPDREGHNSMLFQWLDGPLVQAMKSGGVFLADEISLADDSVLERMNSVLEPEREILLAEKIGQEMEATSGLTTEVVVAETGFRFVGTMNPGGDYGKKELSPALRNRFSEIWCPSLTSREDLTSIINKNITNNDLTENIVEFVSWLQSSSNTVVSIRDVLAWVNFINIVTTSKDSGLSPHHSLWEGAHLVWLDGLQVEGGADVASVSRILTEARQQLSRISETKFDTDLVQLSETETHLSVGPFTIAKEQMNSQPRKSKYSFRSQTISENIRKILRALQISKPILLEGSPGIGKTSLVEALSIRLNKKITRINLSDQTDIADLFGADLPVEGGDAGHFQWRNGPFLNAMEQGGWILLDELNLASQSILEGLNAVFDHRNEVYIPELNRTFPLHPDTKIFACQNPISEGGDRKGLPKSFLNRFSKIFMSGLCKDDYVIICESIHPNIDRDIITKMVQFSSTLEDEIVRKRAWGHSGSPWEFNLRDLLRWCQALESDKDQSPGKWVNLIYLAKMRTEADRNKVKHIFKSIFDPEHPVEPLTGNVYLSLDKIYVGSFSLSRSKCLSVNTFKDGGKQVLMSGQGPRLEMMTGCLSQGWPILLTGPSQAGKTALVHTLANMTGNQVDTLSLNISTDTMELLGGFEQADIERSIGDLWSRVSDWIVQITQELLCSSRIEDGLLFMQRYLQLEQAYKEVSFKRKRDDQLKVLNEVILSVRSTNIGKSQCEQFLMELGKLDSVQQGTFEWVDSLLVRAMERGNWLVLDSANTCSASVLDRLNSVFEDGGRLVVSERGVLGGDIVTVNKHPNFRAFLIYDPVKGEISRAMRNRCVEIHVDTERISRVDQKHLSSFVLGPADCSEDCRDTVETILAKNDGLQNMINKLSLLRHDVLFGGFPSSAHHLQTTTNKINQTTLSVLGTASTSCTNFSLFNILHQMRPLLEILETEPHLLADGIAHFLCHQSSETLSGLVSLLSIMVGEDWANVAKNLSDKFPQKSIYDSRFLPKSYSLTFDDVSQCNKMSLVTRIMTNLERTVSTMSRTDGCVLNVGHLCHEVIIIQQYPPLITKLVSLLMTELHQAPITISDEDWSVLDKSLEVIRHFVTQGGQPVTRDNMETLTRSIAVHWSWVYKHLSSWMTRVKCPQLQIVLDNYDKVVTSSLQMSTQSMTKLKRLLDCAPLPPSCLSSCNTSQTIKNISNDPMLTSGSLHKTNFLSKYGTKLNEQLCAIKTGQLNVETAVKNVQEMVMDFHKIVEDHESIQISPEKFLDVQLCSLKEALNNIQMEDRDHDLLSIRSRIGLNGVKTSQSQQFVHKVLDKFEGSGVKMLEQLSYDPVLMKVTNKEDIIPVSSDLLHVVNNLVSGNVVNIAMAEEKTTQMKEIKNILANFSSDPQIMTLDATKEEITKIINALCINCKVDGSSLPSQLDSLARLPLLFDGYDSLLQEIGNEMQLTSDLQELKLNLLLNILKLQLFCMVGILDPAEKQVIKKNHAQEDLASVSDRLFVFSKYQEIIGCHHPHSQILMERRKQLKEEVKRRKCLTAVRAIDESFYSLSKDMSHFARTIGKVSTILSTFSKISEGSLTESSTWITSVISFVRSVLNYSTFPDLTIPVCEAACKLVVIMERMSNITLETLVRDKWANLDYILQNVASKCQDPCMSLVDQSKWMISGNVLNFFDNKSRILMLKSSLLLFSFTSFPQRGADVLLNVSKTLLQLWRNEEALKEKQEAEAESMYRSKTLCHDEDDDEVAEAEYKSMFPSFSDLYSDIGERMTLDDAPKKELNDVKKEDPITRQNIDETVLILVKILLKKVSKVKAANDQLQHERFLAVLGIIRNCPGILSKKLESKMIPNLVSIVTTHLEKFDGSLDVCYNFYKDCNQEQNNHIRPLLQLLTDKILQLLEMFPENPVLLQILKIKSRISSLSAFGPLPQYLTGFELLLTSCHEWEKNAHKGVSIQAEMDQLTKLILSWRKLELSSLKSLLDDHLDNVREQTICKFWLHVVGIVMEKRNKKEEVVRSLIRFMEAGSLGDFQARLDILESTAKLVEVTGSQSKVHAVLVNLHTYYLDLSSGVEKALREHHLAAEGKMKEFIKIAKWKDTNFWSVQAVMDKTKRALHKVLREFQKNVTSPSNDHFKEIAFDSTKSEDQSSMEIRYRMKPHPPVSSTSPICTSKGKSIGTLGSLHAKSLKWTNITSENLEKLDFISEITNLLPEVVHEMEKLKGLTVDRSKPEEEQKKQAGFIQQRKRARLNELFKTLQNYGFSYRYGVTNCVDINNYDEMYKSGSNIKMEEWKKSEKYFFRCFARYRHLLSLLDRAPPPDIGANLNERFQGFVQHMLTLSRTWREVTVSFLKNMDLLEEDFTQFSSHQKFDLTRSGEKYKALLFSCLDIVEPFSICSEQRSKEFSDIPDLKSVTELCQTIRDSITKKLSGALAVFAPQDNKHFIQETSSKISQVISLLDKIKSDKLSHPVSEEIGNMQTKVVNLRTDLDNWTMQKPFSKDFTKKDVLWELMSKITVSSILGVQEMYKKSLESSNSGASWLQVSNITMEMLKALKISKFHDKMTALHHVISDDVGQCDMTKCFQDISTFLTVSSNYKHLAGVVSKVSVSGLLNLNKFLSVIIKVFCEIMTNGFCPIKDLDDGPSKTSNDFKSSEEESGLGQGEGSKDVSDQIDNEDMLDGAYQNQEDADDNEEKDNKEEDNGIEMSENFESNLQDREDKDQEDDDDNNDDNSNELDDEKGDVDQNEDIDKNMWGDEEEDEEKEDLEEGDKGNSSEEKLDDLSAKEDNEKSEEKRQRKEEKSDENPEFDDDQNDPYHGEDKKFPEPESFDLPDNMDLDNVENEENFEEPDSNEPEVLPDFENLNEEENSGDEEEKDTGTPDVDTLDDVEENPKEDEINDAVESKDEENKESEDMEIDQKVDNKENENGMDVDETSDQTAIDATNENEQEAKDQSSDGLNSSKTNSESKDSFGVVSKENERKDEQDSGSGNKSESEKSLAENTENAEKLDIVEGMAVEESVDGEANIFQHVDNEKETDKTSIDKANEKDIREQVVPENIEDDRQDKDNVTPQLKEENELKKDVTRDSHKKQTESKENADEDQAKIETQGDIVPTFAVSRGTESLISESSQMNMFKDNSMEMDVPMSLEAIQLSDASNTDLPVMTQLSHQLCEQLRLILEPTKASKLQGDFKTGKRLNMRKIIPYIASQFKKDKIWLRRVKPNKREFQILVALDDSSSMSDNQSREMALSSLNTLSSALTLLEVGQLGVLRFGKSAEVIHNLGSQWSQTAGTKIQNQFTFEQKETSLLSLLNLSTKLFMKNSSSASRNLTVSQLLIIVSDGRGIFHEGKEKVMQSVRRARQAGYFCLFLIVENPTAKDSVLDIRLPVFSGGKLVSIDSYMEHFPFDHYIVLRDVNNLPRTLSDALRQWFELVIS